MIEPEDPMYVAEIERMMDDIDSQPKAIRALVHEFGVSIVARMLDDGYTNAKELRDILRVWRDRRQDELLKLEVITEKVAAAFKRAVGRGR